MNTKQEKNLLSSMWTWFSMTCIHCARIAWHFGIFLFVIAAVVITVFRFWLPALVDRKAEVENFLTNQIGQPVVIGEMAADWRGLYPALHARKLALIDPDSKDVVQLSLDELSLYLDIIPLIQGKFVFREINLKSPVVHVSRSTEGDIYIGKFKAPTPKKGRLALFFQQQKVSITDGRFTWQDHLLKENLFAVSSINISMENAGKRHLLEGSAMLPGVSEDAVSVSYDIRGNMPELQSWSGNITTQLRGIEFSRLPGILHEKLAIPSFSGTASLNVSSLWQDGVVKTANGHISGHDLLFSAGDFGLPFAVNSIEADIYLQHKSDSWLLSLDNPLIAIADEPWHAGRIKASYSNEKSSVHISKVKLSDLRPVLDALTSENKIVQLVKDLYPSGNGHNVSLNLYGPINKPTDFLYRMSVSDGTVNAYSVYPAATGLAADISVTRAGGSVVAEGQNSRIDLDRVYEKPLEMDELQANVSWSKGEDSWKVDGKRIWLKNSDAEVVAKFIATVPFERSLPPLLRLDVDLINGNLSQADHYYPVRLMNPGIRKWFEDTGFRGRLNTARLNYEGTAKGFPVKGAKDFKVTANIEGGSMLFAPGWPRLTGINADLLLGKNDLWVNGTARDLSGQTVDSSTVHILHLAEPGKQNVNVRTGMTGDLGKIISFLQTGPLFKNTAIQEIRLAGRGNGTLKLDVSIPLASASNTLVNGEYKTDNAALQLPDASWITKLKGGLSFTERAISSSNLQGVMRGGPVSLSINTLKEGQPPLVEMEAKGVAHASNMGTLIGDWIADELKGKAAWQGKMRFESDKVILHLDSDLIGLSSSFPYPLSKQNSVKLPLKLDVSFLPEQKMKLEFFMPSFANGKLFFTEQKQEMALTGGCILIGKTSAECSERKGLAISLEQAMLDIDPWDNYIKEQEGDDGIPEVLTRMSAKLGKTFYSGVDMADIDVKFDRLQDNSWAGKVNGERIKGDIAFNWDRSSKWLKTRLSHAIWNEAEKETLSAGPPQNPTEFPILDVVIEDMVFHGMKLGRLSLHGEPVPGNWELQYLKLDRPEMKVSATGRWSGLGPKQTSSFGVDFTSTDMLTTLQAMGFNVDFESEKFRTTGDISWQGAPYDYRMENLDGKLDIHSDKGRLSSVEVGAGRLLGVLNVENLRRRLLLDFSDLSEEGFAFDQIDADMTIKRGIAAISKFIMPGPSATIRLEGELGLVKRDVNMQMSISPAVGGNLTVAGFVLGGPAGGVVTYLASKAIKKQMDKASNYQYTISGLWDDPVVDKIQSTETNENAGTIGSDIE
jgi:uncharacterized protein (TIGR02099 family)